MNKLFNNILVPIDFSHASELAIEKAIDIANHFKCHIHLLFAESSGLLATQPLTISKNLGLATADAASKLYQLQNKYTYQLHPGLSFHSCFRKGNRNRSIIEYAIRHQIDLVIIGKAPRTINTLISGGCNVNEISNHIDCPVMSVRQDAANEGWMNIVLPICSMLPVRKMMFASYLARKYNSKIHLVSIAGDYGKDADCKRYLYKAYQLLRDNTNLNIECHTVPGHNIADTTLRFAKKINADLILVNPGKECHLSGIFNRLLPASLFNESRIPVMAISRI
jgi:nucleotide-binding universal stress UspA family protein